MIYNYNMLYMLYNFHWYRFIEDEHNMYNML